MGRSRKRENRARAVARTTKIGTTTTTTSVTGKPSGDETERVQGSKREGRVTEAEVDDGVVRGYENKQEMDSGGTPLQRSLQCTAGVNIDSKESESGMKEGCDTSTGNTGGPRSPSPTTKSPTPPPTSPLKPPTPEPKPSPPQTRYRDQPRVEDVMLPVECGPNVALINLNKLHQGSRGACVKFENTWMTPNQFQMISGRETAKDWKRSIKHHGKSLKILLNNDLLVLEPPVCLCEVCTAEPGTLQAEKSNGGAENKNDDSTDAPSSTGTDRATSLAGEEPLPGPSRIGGFIMEKKKDLSDQLRDKKPRKRKRDNPSKAATSTKKKRKDHLGLSSDMDDTLGDSVDSDRHSLMERATGTMDFYEFISTCAPELKSDLEISKFAKELTKVTTEDSEINYDANMDTHEPCDDRRMDDNNDTQRENNHMSSPSHRITEDFIGDELGNAHNVVSGHAMEEPHSDSKGKEKRKRPKGSRLSSIIDVLRKNKEGPDASDTVAKPLDSVLPQGVQQMDELDTQELQSTLEAASMSSREKLRHLLLNERNKPLTSEEISTVSNTSTKKSDLILPGTSTKSDSRPKVATVPPLSHSHKPSTPSKPVKKPTSRPSPMPMPMGTDFLNITNPAHFGWYLPYYASLGLANMMMVPFLSSQMMAFQSTASSVAESLQSNRSHEEEEAVARSSSQQPVRSSSVASSVPHHSSSNFRTPISSPYVSSSHSHNRTYTLTSPSTPSTTSESPLDLSLGKGNEKAHGKASQMSRGASPLDLSVKMPDVSSTVGRSPSSSTHSSRKSTVPRHKQSSSRKSLTCGGGFMNPSLDAISRWSIEDVTKFVSSVEGCQQYTKNFRQLGVCGKSLPYLSLDHMTGLLHMCPSSAVSLRSAIDRLLLLPDSVISSQI